MISWKNQVNQRVKVDKAIRQGNIKYLFFLVITLEENDESRNQKTQQRYALFEIKFIKIKHFIQLDFSDESRRR